MRLLHGFSSSEDFRGGYASIGNFDGVHRGHQAMIAALVRRARDADVPAVAFTFEPHPIRLLRPAAAPPSLSTLECKAELLGACGVDFVVAYPTDRALLALTPQEFFERIVKGELAARGLVEGPNFFYGHDRAGDVRTLRASCDAAGLTLDVVEPVRIGERLVSSSEARQLIEAGRLAEAVELLGHPYRLTGRVVAGAARGRTIGFPTANLSDVVTLLPRDGVYAGRVRLDGATHAAAINVGGNPTFAEGTRKIEAHVIGWSGDLYGRDLDVDLLARLRDTRPFDGVDSLRKQLTDDVAAAERIASVPAASSPPGR